MAKFPRRRSGTPDPDDPKKPNAIVAAATRISRPIKGANGGYGNAPKLIKIEEWQAEAWRQYDICPELHFGTNWLANSIGRCRLTVVDVDESGVIGPPTDNAEVIAMAAGLLDDPALQHEMLAGLTKNLTVAGDSYVIASPDPATGEYDEWIYASAHEVTIGIDGEVWVNRGNGDNFKVDTEQSLVIRVHRPHPRCWSEADSPTRAALIVLRELEELSKYLFATVNSRLAGAGILALPSEMSFQTPTQETGTTAGDDFIDILTEGMVAPIEDMSNPSALVPIVVQAPKDAIGGIQWLVSPNADLPAQIESLRKAAIARLALVLDMDVSSLTGTGTTNHWGEWAIEEQSIKFHVEPVMILICNAFTEGFLKPSLIAAGLDPDRFAFWYDPADLINRPNKSTDAKDLYDRGELSGAALRRECAFTELDAPDDSERRAQQLQKIMALAPTVAEQILQALLDELGFKIKIQPIAQPDGTPPQDSTPAPNKDPKAIPAQPKTPPTSPRKDGKTPEAN